MQVCMCLKSPGLSQPPAYCLESNQNDCTSRNIFRGRRERKINDCLNGKENDLKGKVQTHVDNVGIHQFRAQNEDDVFGDDFRELLELLKDVEQLDFSGVSLGG